MLEYIYSNAFGDYESPKASNQITNSGSKMTNLEFTTMDFYTDASANDKTKDIFGVWGFIAIDDLGNRTTKTGICENLDNNASEILAVAEVFEFVLQLPVKPKCITIHTDCDKNYKALNGWIEEIAERGWETPRNSRGKKQSRKRNRGGLFEHERDDPKMMANKDLWAFFYAKKLEVESFFVEIKAVKVKAHSGHHLHDTIDAIVRGVMRKERGRLAIANSLVLKKRA